MKDRNDQAPGRGGWLEGAQLSDNTTQVDVHIFVPEFLYTHLQSCSTAKFMY